jgi:hypothetical protein
MIEKLVRNVPGWYSMDSFKEENLTFLVGLKSDQLSGVTDFVKHALGSYDEPKNSFLPL